MELITRQIIREKEGEDVDRTILTDYADPDSDRYRMLLDEIRKKLNFTTLQYNRLDDLVEAIGIDKDRLCTYCWDGRE